MSGFPADLSSPTLNNNTSTRPIPIPIPIPNQINNNNPSIIYNQQRPGPHGLLPLPSQNAYSFGKRTLSDFQSQQQQQYNPLLLRHLQQHQGIGIGIGIGSRSVKPRIYQNTSSISTLLPEIGGSVFNTNNNNHGLYAAASLLRPQNMTAFGTGSVVLPNHNHDLNKDGAVVIQNRSNSDSTETEKMMIMNRLQELEKQLLDDDVDDQAGESVSVITGNEWAETIQNLLVTTTPHQQQQQPQQQQQQPHVNTSSPTSSSSSCSSTVASPVPICCKQLIKEAAAAIADGKLDSAAEIVTRVSESANPRGTPDQRLAYYMSLSLKSKLSPVDVTKSASSIRSKEHHESVQLLYHYSNCFKLGFLAANLAIIEATADAKSLHVVDFDLGDGKQYHTLLQFLALRKSGIPASVKITVVDILERSSVSESGDERSRIALERLSQLGERVGIPLEVKPLRFNKVSDVTRESLSSNVNEVLTVNMAHILSKLPDESVSIDNQRDELLRRVKSLKARIVTVVEQEMNCNTAPLQIRVAECCTFYGALFDSLDNSGIGKEDPERIRVEEGLGRVMMNTLTCEGRERVERCEVLGKWRARMGMAGFEMKPVSQNVVDSLSSMVINKNNSSNSVTVSGGGGCGVGTLFVKEVNGGVGFGWMGRILTVTSAWR